MIDFTDHIIHLVTALSLIVTTASAVCAATPTPAPDSRYAKLYRIIEFLGLIVGKAKDTGLLPPPPPK